MYKCIQGFPPTQRTMEGTAEDDYILKNCMNSETLKITGLFCQ